MIQPHHVSFLANDIWKLVMFALFLLAMSCSETSRGFWKSNQTFSGCFTVSLIFLGGTMWPWVIFQHTDFLPILVPDSLTAIHLFSQVFLLWGGILFAYCHRVNSNYEVEFEVLNYSLIHGNRSRQLCSMARMNQAYCP